MESTDPPGLIILKGGPCHRLLVELVIAETNEFSVPHPSKGSYVADSQGVERWAQAEARYVYTGKRTRRGLRIFKFKSPVRAASEVK